MINSSRTQRHLHTKAMLSGEDLHKIENGVFGTVLPSVILGMLPFAKRPVFARRLLPMATKFVQRLDELLEIHPYLSEQGATASSSQTDPSSSNGQMNSTSPTPTKQNILAASVPLHDPDSVDGTITTAMSTASSSMAPSKASLMTPFSWMPSLVKSSSLLAGSLAKTMVDCESGKDKGADKVLSSKWSKLCSKGIDRRYFPIFTRHGLSTPASSNLLPVLAPVPPLAFSPSYAELCEYLRGYIASKDMGYFVVVKHFRGSAHDLNMSQFEHTFFAAALKHDGLAAFAATYASNPRPQTARPPAPLILTWRVVSEATKWLWSRRSQIKAADSEEDAGGSVDAKIDSLFESAKATLSLVQLLSPLCDKAVLPITGWLKPSTSRARVRWRRAVNLVVCAIRWYKLGDLASRVHSSPVSALFKSSGEGSRQIFSHVTGYEKSDSAAPAGSDLRSKSVLGQLLSSYLLSASRVDGLGGFYKLFRSIKSISTRSLILREFTRAVKEWPSIGAAPATGKDTASCVVFDGLVGQESLASVGTSFENVYIFFLEELKKFDPRSPSPSPLFNSASMQYFLLLLDAWGIAFSGDSSGFLSSCGIFGTLSALLRYFDGYSPDSDDQDPSSDKGKAPHFVPPASSLTRRSSSTSSTLAARERSVQVMRCRQATWALLRLLATQSFASKSSLRLPIYGPSPALSVLYDQALAAIDTMTTSPSTEPDPADANSKSKASSNPNHRKRCQEVRAEKGRVLDVDANAHHRYYVLTS